MQLENLRPASAYMLKGRDGEVAVPVSLLFLLDSRADQESKSAQAGVRLGKLPYKAALSGLKFLIR